MSTNWRHKTYYRPRVLISTEHIIDPQFSDCVVCLTGPQLEMMRNLTQYLKRRSTFSESENTQGYLTPDAEDWDTIQAIVADLEDTLMNCDEFTAKLESILDAALCACAGTDGGYTSPVTGPIYEEKEEDGQIAWVPEDPTPSPIEAKACAMAQLVYAWNYEILTEVLQPTQEAAHEVLLFLLFESLAIVIGGPPALLPGAALFYVVQAMLDAWVEAELANVVNALIANKQELICAMYIEFLDGGTYGDASAAADVVIDGVSAWTDIDKTLFRMTFSPLAMMICQAAITADSDWADSNVVPGYCVDCEREPITSKDVTWPPCENGWFRQTGFCADNGWKCAFNLGGTGELNQYFVLGDPLVYATVDDMTITLTWYSELADEISAAWLRLWRWDTGTEQWVQFVNRQLWVDSEDAMTTPTVSVIFGDTGMPDVGSLIKIGIPHGLIQGAEYPTDFMLGRFQMEWSMTEL